MILRLTNALLILNVAASSQKLYAQGLRFAYRCLEDGRCCWEFTSRCPKSSHPNAIGFRKQLPRTSSTVEKRPNDRLAGPNSASFQLFGRLKVRLWETLMSFGRATTTLRPLWHRILYSPTGQLVLFTGGQLTWQEKALGKRKCEK